MKIEADIPCVYPVRDYHDIAMIREIFRMVLRGVKVVEVNGGDYPDSESTGYFALIYTGVKPDKKIIVRLLNGSDF